MSGKYAFTKGLKEVRFHLCQSSEHSAATRAFLTRAYPTMKRANPHTPILIREALDVEPKVWARYEYGTEKMQPLSGLDDKGVESRVTELVQATS
ncbi:MAG: hypothetical protein M1828_004557 [Chrysothrix sp. TS-e1954]|nr:MAG: hypothetical protein M1828_004557 [Chrysothrix sp. TS-e1954]